MFVMYIEFNHRVVCGWQMDVRRRRGLLLDSDEQVFTVSLPRKFRALYDRILLPLSNFVVRSA